MRLLYLFATSLAACQHCADVRAEHPAPRGDAGVIAVWLLAAVGTVGFIARDDPAPCHCTAPDTAHVYPRMKHGETYRVDCAGDYAPAVHRNIVNGTVESGWRLNATAACDCRDGDTVRVRHPCEPAIACTVVPPTRVYMALPAPGRSLYTANFSYPIACWGPFYTPATSRPGEPRFPYALPCTEPGGGVSMVGCVHDPPNFTIVG